MQRTSPTSELTSELAPGSGVRVMKALPDMAETVSDFTNRQGRYVHYREVATSSDFLPMDDVLVIHCTQ